MTLWLIGGAVVIALAAIVVLLKQIGTYHE